jgi:NAD(P)-dependent dehydrogenase (short-subunit alcohol dehydrogenase family)
MSKPNATAAVIGAGDYIGTEIAKKFAAEGFTIFAGLWIGVGSRRRSAR